MPRLVILILCLIALPAAAAERDVEVEPGVVIHLIDAGPRNAKPPLVLIPGWRLTADIWREQIDTFSRDRRVVAIDPRSQGRSTLAAEGNTPEQRAKDLRALMLKLDLHGVVLVGWSQGAQDVASYVDQAGVADLKGVVLVDTTISRGAGSVATSLGAAEQLNSLSLYVRYPREATEGMMHAIMRKPMPKDRFDRIVADALKTPTATGSALLTADLFGVDRSGALAKMTVPTLVVTSSFAFDVEAQQVMAAKLPRGRFVKLDDAGHAVFVDQPRAFDEALAAFMAPLD